MSRVAQTLDSDETRQRTMRVAMIPWKTPTRMTDIPYFLSCVHVGVGSTAMLAFVGESSHFSVCAIFSTTLRVGTLSTFDSMPPAKGCLRKMPTFSVVASFH